jgi:hypothetical protein
MKQHLRGCLLWLLMLAVAGSAAVSAQATTSTQRFTQPFVLDGMHPCTGEAVTLRGELVITTRTTVDSNGGFHSSFRLVPQHVIGESDSGITYRAVGGHREHVNVSADQAPATFTLTDMFNVLSQGGADNYSAFTLIHVTVNSDGVATAETSLRRVECRA